MMGNENDHLKFLCLMEKMVFAKINHIWYGENVYAIAAW